MKLSIVSKHEAAAMLGKYNAEDIWPTRNVFIDDKLVPQALADIILLGLDVATEQYFNYIDELRKEGHHV